MKWLLFWLNISITLCLCFLTSDYCDPQLCPKGKHIACNNSGEVPEQCGKIVYLLPMTSRRKQLILHLHNSLRNDIALGKIAGYSKADRMAVLRWDSELQKLAQLNVKQCKMAHDSCRNTDKYHFVGQNIGIRKTYPKFLVHAQNIRHIVTEWFNEYKNCNQTYIDSYQKHPDKRKKIGHFTGLMNDRCVSLGCAAILFESQPGNKKTFLMTCNYSSTNFRNRPVYRSGPSGSKCTTGLSSRYDGLCTYRENIYSNPI